MAEFKIKKTDSRYNGAKHFKYIIEYSNSLSVNLTFQQHRNWWWEVYGASCEIDAWVIYNKHNPVALAINQTIVSQTWAWSAETGVRRIYVKDDETLSLFVLKFSA